MIRDMLNAAALAALMIGGAVIGSMCNVGISSSHMESVQQVFTGAFLGAAIGAAAYFLNKAGVLNTRDPPEARA
jgi:hypothetical protein